MIFKDSTPFSSDFDDFHPNSKDGLDGSKFVYSEAFEFEKSGIFIVAESGLDIGLNLFLTPKRFLQAERCPKKLFHTSIESFYIGKDKLREIYQKPGFYEEFKEILETFLKFYPKAKRGYYRFYFKDCFLDLISDDIAILRELNFNADV